MQQESRLQYLLNRLIAHDASEIELQELEAVVKADESGQSMQQVETILSQFPSVVTGFDEEHWQQVASTILSSDKMKEAPVRTLRTGWLKYAAAILIIFGISAYLWNLSHHAQQP